MWFWLSLIALLCWSGSDLFSKIGCRDARDKYSHLKMVMAVGVVMGLHAAYEVFVGGTVINLDIILTYLPVSILYILSMAMGYVGLRYIELSISSPICNSSGALVAVLAILFDGIAGYSPLALFAVALVCVGAVGLGVVEAREDDELRIERQKASNYKYTKSFMALAMPAAYCVLDAAGTFADSRVLEIISRTVEDYEASANVAYELTFLLAAVVVLRLCGAHQEGPAGAEDGGPQVHWAPSARPPDSSPTSTPSRTRSIWPCPRPSSPPTARPPCCGAGSS